MSTSTRLSQATRESIKRKVLASKFDDRFAAHEAKVSAFGEALLDSAVAGGFNIASAPPGWFPESVELKAYVNGAFVKFHLAERRRMPYKVYNDYLRFGADDPEGRKYADLKQELSVLTQEREELGRELDSVLGSCNTMKQLLALWPEVTQYVPKVSAPVPMIVNADRLRNLINK